MITMTKNKKYLKAVLPTILISALAACSSDNPMPAPDPASSNALMWSDCDDASEQFQCSSLKVPMDYSQTDGEQIDIALIRSQATGPNRLGSLFVNFGGASGSGVRDVQDFIKDVPVPDSILAAYDIVGFDPRGAGGSTPVDCSDVGDSSFNLYPADTTAVAQQHADFVEFSTACAAKYGPYLQHLGSINIVRDMEQIRIAMGDEKVNFLAYSFASRVAALYLQEYPESSGRLVLDGAVSPDSALRIILSDPLPGMQAALQSIVEECRTVDPDCDPDALMATLAARLTELASNDTEDSLNELDLVLETLFELIEDPENGKRAFSGVVDYINNTAATDPENPNNDENPASGENPGGDQEPDGGEPDEPIDEEIGDDGITVETALYCADDPLRPDVDLIVAAFEEFNQRSDIFGESSASEFARCAGWPEAIAPLDPIVTNTAPVSIVIGGVNDAVAPIVLSEELAAAIGGHYIRSDHSGHISVFLNKSDCVDDAVETFLLTGETPAFGECSVN